MTPTADRPGESAGLPWLEPREIRLSPRRACHLVRRRMLDPRARRRKKKTLLFIGLLAGFVIMFTWTVWHEYRRMRRIPMEPLLPVELPTDDVFPQPRPDR